MSMKPLHITSPLFDTPKKNPVYSAPVTLGDGTEIEAVDPRATRAMVALMDMQAVLGGAASHWGGPSAFAELMSATHAYMFHKANEASTAWYKKFHFVNDAGHCENGLYAIKANYKCAGLDIDKLKGFRSIESNLTGHGEAHLFPEGVYISNGPLGSGIPQAQGLCAADALAENKRVTITAISDGGCMEGEAREALAAIPGLANKGLLAGFVLIISDNNTKLSGRIDEESYSMQPTFQSLAAQGWKVIDLERGNDLQCCMTAIEEAVNWAEAHPEKPVVIHARTVKGYGIKKTEESSSGGHGFPLKKPSELDAFLAEIYGGEVIPDPIRHWTTELIDTENQKKANPSSVSLPKVKVQEGVARALIQSKQKGFPVVSVTSDLPGSTGVAAFRNEFPKSCFDVGIAESNMVSMAAGLSKEGFIPVVDTFAQFGVTKGALPFIMASLSQAPIIAVFSHAGFQDAADGASHQALAYFAMSNAIPHVDTYALSTSAEAEALVSQAIEEFSRKRQEGKVPHSSIFFLGRETFQETVMPEGSNYKLGRAQVISDSTDQSQQSVTLVAAGPLLHQAILASSELLKLGIGSCVVNPSCINNADAVTIGNCLKKTGGRLVTVEDHQLTGGMGSVLVHKLLLEGVAPQLRSLGVAQQFGQSAYKASELYSKHGLDAKAIVEAANSFFNN